MLRVWVFGVPAPTVGTGPAAGQVGRCATSRAKSVRWLLLGFSRQNRKYNRILRPKAEMGFHFTGNGDSLFPMAPNICFSYFCQYSSYLMVCFAAIPH